MRVGSSRHDDFRDGTTEPAEHRMFLDGEDGPALGCGFNRGAVERPGGCHVDHSGLDTPSASRSAAASRARKTITRSR